MIAVLAFAACNAGCEIARPRARRLSQRDLPFASLVEGGTAKRQPTRNPQHREAGPSGYFFQATPALSVIDSLSAPTCALRPFRSLAGHRANEKGHAVGACPLWRPRRQVAGRARPTVHNDGKSPERDLLAACRARVLSCSDTSKRRAGGERDHTLGPDPDSVGRDIYVCDNGANYAVDLFKGGLTIDLSAPNERPVRLSAFAQDQTYVGAGVTARVSGREMDIQRINRPALRCQRTGGRQ